MHFRKIPAVLSIVLMLSILGSSAAFASELSASVGTINKSRSAEPLDQGELEAIASAAAASADPDSYGGHYFDDNGQLVYCIKGQDIPLTLQAAGNGIVFEQVKYSLAELEEMKDSLVPYMQSYGIVVLDANEAINKVTIQVKRETEALDKLLSTMFDTEDYEVIEKGEDFEISTTVLPVTDADSDALP